MHDAYILKDNTIKQYISSTNTARTSYACLGKNEAQRQTEKGYPIPRVRKSVFMLAQTVWTEAVAGKVRNGFLEFPCFPAASA